MTVRVAVVVVNYGSSQLLEANPLLRVRPHDTSVVIVDNMFSADERKCIVRLAEECGWEAVLNDTNVGFGAGANAGVERAAQLGAQVCVLLNPDAQISVAHLELLVDRVRAEPRALVGPKIVKQTGETWSVGGRIGRISAYQPLESDGPFKPDWLTGACIAFETRRFLELGGFDEEYFLYWEDVDLSVRWTRAGGALVLDPSVVVTHSVGGTQDSPSGGKSAVYLWHTCRNRLLFARKNMSTARYLFWLATAPLYALRWLRGAGIIRSGRIGHLCKSLVTGTVAGIRITARPRRTSGLRSGPERPSGLSV